MSGVSVVDEGVGVTVVGEWGMTEVAREDVWMDGYCVIVRVSG